MRVAIYIRVSTQRQEEEGYSLEHQERVLTEYAKNQRWRITGLYRDVDSGAKLDKDGLTSVLDLVEQGEIDVVLVIDQDRLSRLDTIEWELLKAKLRANDVKIAQPGRITDLKDDTDEFMSNILNIVAIHERKQITRRMVRGKLEHARSGLHTGGGGVCYGYRYIPESNQLVIDEYEAEIVRLVFDKFINGVTISSICAHLKKNYPMPNRNSFADGTIKRWLENETFIGMTLWGGEAYKGQHEPIIDEATFNRAQALLRERPHGNAFIRQHLLSGLIHCKRCGLRFNGRKSERKRKILEGSVIINYYRCTSKLTRQAKRYGVDPCDNKTYRADALESEVINQVKKFAFEYLKHGDTQERDKTVIKTLEGKIKDIDIQTEKILDLYLTNKMPENVLDKKSATLKKEKNLLIKELEQRKKEETHFDAKEKREIANNICNFDWDNENIESKRTMLQKIIKRIDTDEEEIFIIFYD